MKIAVLGWYGHDNAGDERIKYCLNEFLMTLGGIEYINFYDLHENAIQGKTNKFNQYDLVIIGGGGLILSQHNYHDFILGIDTKVITLGISLETELTGNPKRFAEALLEKSQTFLVRDRSSYEKLSKLDTHKKLKLSYDLTFLKSYTPLNMMNRKKVGINLLAMRVKPHESKMKKQIVSVFNKIGFNHHPNIIQFDEMIHQLKDNYELVPIPLYCVQQKFEIPEYQMNDVNVMRKYFDTVSNGFNDEEIDNCNLLISMRLHGLIFAVQKGIPPIAFSIYPKQINFMKELGLEMLIMDIKERHHINRPIEYMMSHENDINDKIMAYNTRARKSIELDVMNALSL